MILSKVSDSQSPDVSVIIPTYNRISMLEEALISAFSQDFDGVVEIIVVDDNSQDGTSEVVSQKYPEVNLISLKENVGAYVARNRAILKAKGKYIAFLDSDDIWEKNYLRTQIATLEDKKRCFCVSAVLFWYTQLDKKLIRLQKPNLKKYTSAFHQLLVEGSFIATPSSAIFPRQLFHEVGLFDETYRISGDTDLYIRCLLNDYQPVYTEGPLVTWRKHDQSQATDHRNGEIRKKIRLSLVNKYHHLIEKRVDIPSINLVRAQIYAKYATRYLHRKKIIAWLISLTLCAYNASPKYALFNGWQDISKVIKKKIILAG
jgi:glycosyltransferase involved in cell wall biosynthesis